MSGNFSNFFDEFEHRITVLRCYREQLNRFVAQEFNLIDFLRPDEYRLSELIAFLLNPRAEHGQGPIFLQKFLERLQRDSVPAASRLLSLLAKGDGVRLKLEDQTLAHRRIDIVIGIGSVGIGIENKPWALDQIDQLEDYARDLEQRYRLGWALVYIRGYTGAPSEQALPPERRKELLADHHYVEWSYVPDIADWIETCASVCAAEKVRWLLRDLHAYVLNSFNLGSSDSGNVGRH